MSRKTNLLSETMVVLHEHDYHSGAVIWVGSRDGTYAMGWNEFRAIADVEYDSGFGVAEIASDLVVVGDGWWLERSEYEGAEGWDFKKLPVRSDSPKSFSKVHGALWPSLSEIEKEEAE